MVLCQLTFSHLEDLESVLEEFARILSTTGVLVVACHYPFHDFLVVREREYPDIQTTYQMDLDPEVIPDQKRPDYHAIERFQIDWSGTGENPATYYRRSLTDLLQPILRAGFVLDDVVEPLPDEEFEVEYPEAYEELRHRPPEIICLRAHQEDPTV